MMDLKAELASSIGRNPSLTELIEKIQQFKLDGGKQTQALEVLEEIRSKAKNGEEEDILLELMDFVTGFCSPQARIWG